MEMKSSRAHRLPLPPTAQSSTTNNTKQREWRACDTNSKSGMGAARARDNPHPLCVCDNTKWRARDTNSESRTGAARARDNPHSPTPSVCVLWCVSII